MDAKKTGDTLVETLMMETDVLLNHVEGELKEIYGEDNVSSGKKFRYAKGDIPIMLIAHVDTVHANMPSKIILNKKRTKMWGNQGLGADDRVGVFMIRHIIRSGYRPHVLFTDEEETGGDGAREASGDLCPMDVRLCIELDRMNDNDMVFYDCPSRMARDYCGQFGWKESRGSFTDISILCPEWGIAGVNLSVGYYYQHTQWEEIRIKELCSSYQRVVSMLRKPPEGIIIYQTDEEKKEKAKKDAERFSLYSYGKYLDDYPTYYGNGRSPVASNAVSTLQAMTPSAPPNTKELIYDEQKEKWVEKEAKPRKKSIRTFNGDVDKYLIRELNFSEDELRYFDNDEKEAMAIEHQEEVERGWHK